MIVIDASVAVKWVIPEADSLAALALQGEILSAPEFWLAEAASALWRHVRVGELSEPEANLRLLRLRSAPVTGSPIKQDIEKAFAIANDLSHPIYDCLYLALALREEAQFVTADMLFARAIRKHGEWSSVLRVLGEA